CREWPLALAISVTAAPAGGGLSCSGLAPASGDRRTTRETIDELRQQSATDTRAGARRDDVRRGAGAAPGPFPPGPETAPAGAGGAALPVPPAALADPGCDPPPRPAPWP